MKAETLDREFIIKERAKAELLMLKYEKIFNHFSELLNIIDTEQPQEESISIDSTWKGKIKKVLLNTNRLMLSREICEKLVKEYPEYKFDQLRPLIAATLKKMKGDGMVFDYAPKTMRGSYYGLSQWFEDGKPRKGYEIR